MKILIVEDERVSARFLEGVLQEAGWTVAGIAASGEEACQIAQTRRPDAVLMDVMIKGAQSGCETAVAIRRLLPGCSIVFLTAHAEDEMLAYAVDVKAEGYLLKPYNEREIVATLRLIESRRRGPLKQREDSTVLLAEGYAFDLKKRRLINPAGKEVVLTAQMLDLFELLARAEGAALPAEQLCLALWGDCDQSGRLRALVHRLRRQIGGGLVESFKRIGYRVKAP
ncbi:MAG: response regulator [Campylobacterales bacterium]